jgi:UDP-N-acetylglucosamine 2-epimerase (non-hydrolysing)
MISNLLKRNSLNFLNKMTENELNKNHQPKKILFIYGTRPEAIKMAPVINQLKDDFITEVCVTAQHRSLLDDVNQLFDIVPDYDLKIYGDTKSISDTLTLIISRLADVLAQSQPDLVLVHGDTTSTLAGGLASFYSGIKVGHVEAGLRTNNLSEPWPEEGNRQIVSRIASIHFAPTTRARLNLLEEGINPKNIYVTGNTVIDALKSTLKKNVEAVHAISQGLEFDRTVLITCHRRENFGDGINNVVDAILHLAKTHETWRFIWPTHPNPNVKMVVTEKLSNLKNVVILDPVPYKEFCHLMNSSDLILTDSGGIQEEAPSIGKPVFVLRNETERPEAIDAGTVKLVGTSKKNIIEEVEQIFENPEIYSKMATASNPYGNGHASKFIADALSEFFV